MRNQLTLHHFPKGSPVTLPVVKNYLRIEHQCDDELLNFMIKAATNKIERYIMRSMIMRQFVLRVWQSRDNIVLLPYGPVQKIISVEYNSSKKVTLVADKDYKTTMAQGLNAIVIEAKFQLHEMTDQSFVIEYQSGYGSEPEEIPEDLRLGVMLLVKRLYDDRYGESQMIDLPDEVQSLLNSYKFLSINAEIPPYPLRSLLK